MKSRKAAEEGSLGGGNNAALLFTVAYFTLSILMTLTNKAVLSSYHFNFPFLLLLWQNSFTFLLALLFVRGGQVSVRPPSWSLIRSWIPLSILFMLNVATSAKSTRLLSVPTVTVFKNMQTILIAAGDYSLFGQRHSRGVILSLGIMLLGSLCLGLSDLEFNFLGYTWMLSNVVTGTIYVLYMRFTTKQTASSGMDSVFYNNGLSMPLLVVAVFLSGESYSVIHDRGEFEPSLEFMIIFFFSGFCGFALSFSAFMLISATSATTYSIVGQLNKIPTTILGILLFGTPVSLIGGLSIMTSLVGGIIYTEAKRQEKMQKDLKSDGERMV